MSLGKAVTVSREFHGNTISIETGYVAKQASGSVVVRSGDSVVLVTAVLGSERDGDFLPLTIDYVEKTYAAGKIPGGFFKREGKLSDNETLTARFIDRPCRPLFTKGFNYEVQVIATVLSSDPEVDTDVLALCGASCAISLSEMPFDGPIAGVRVARIDGTLAINPPYSSLEDADLNFIVAGSRDAIVMVEGGAKQVGEKEVLEALFFAHEELKKLIDMQEELVKQVGKPKMEFVPREIEASLKSELEQFAKTDLLAAVQISDKHQRRDAIKVIKSAVKEKFGIAEGDEDVIKQREGDIDSIFEKLQSETVRGLLFDTGKRIDGRDNKTVRPIEIQTSYLPRVHGSSLFTRGETQAIVTATLGVESDAQRIDSLKGETFKSFMLHYNFPPFSVGETKPLRGPGRREVGHGHLAERALAAVLPEPENFPYTIRIVSEITESNGSSSMASVCGGTLALMDAGVPIIAPVAGVAMGLIASEKKTVVLTDILGDEDHLGDMDFKVCGTEEGITALQMDIKIKGLSQDIMTQALQQAREARLHILGKMKEALSEVRQELNEYAPRIVALKIPTDKIRDLIGPSGKTIKGIQETWEVKINIEDSGDVTISGNDAHKLQNAIETVKTITAKPEVGRIYEGIVKRIADFGAFVEIIPGTDGLVHISQLSEGHVKRVEDVVTEGDQVRVKVLEVDRMGKIRLSMKKSELESGEEAGAAAH
ncbi:MAG: polyribonucleotide nucleotidyltransferase [Bdellovibrionales bacterium]|nr:polyribonucleotide nucleotidyltransferase [Bdellovibrionales bacterium]